MRVRVEQILLGAIAPLSITLLGACTTFDHAAVCNDFLAKATRASADHDYVRAQEALNAALREAKLSDDVSQQRRVLREQASTCLLQGNAKGAETAARQLIEIYDQMADRTKSVTQRTDLAEDRSRARIILSDALLALKRPREAAAVLSQANSELESVPADVALAANVGHHYADALRLSGKDVDAKVDLESDLLSKLQSDDLCTRAWQLVDSRSYDQAIGLFKKAQQAATEAGAEDQYVRATAALACAYYLNNRPAEAYKQARSAVRKAQSNNVGGTAKSFALGALALTTSNQDEATEALRTSLSVSAYDAFEILSRVADRHTDAPFSGRARECEMCWSLAPGISASNRLRTISLRFLIFDGTRERKNLAIAWFLEHAKQPTVRPEERAITYEFAAQRLQDEGRTAESLSATRQALILREHLSQDDIVSSKPAAAFALAFDCERLGRPQESIAAAQHGLTQLPPTEACSHNDLWCSAHLTQEVARGYFELQQYRKAVVYYDKTLLICKKADGLLPEKDVLAERAIALARIGSKVETKDDDQR